MDIWLISLGVLASGILAIWFGYRQPQGGFYLFKPLTMVLIILILVLGSEGVTLYKGLILGGLIFSLLGDIFLMLPGDRFQAGLAAFLVAHLFYIVGFLIDQGKPVFWPIVPMIGLAGLMVWILRDGFGEIRFPAYAYIGALAAMVWLAWSRWITGGQLDHLLAFMGAGFFALSDLILGINKFKVEMKAARALDLLTYYTGQWLIALSVIVLNCLEL